LYIQLLIAASFALASYQDIKDRAVSDLVWIPALAGTALAIYSLAASGSYALLEFDLVKILLFGGLTFAMVYFGRLGEADFIGMVFFVADPYPSELFLALIGVLIVALPHLIYLLATGGARGTKTISVDQFLREKKWIPKATILDGVRTEVSDDVNEAREEVEKSRAEGMSVEVSFGTPTVAYLGLGYIIYVAYLITLDFLPFFGFA